MNDVDSIAPSETSLIRQGLIVVSPVRWRGSGRVEFAVRILQEYGDVDSDLASEFQSPQECFSLLCQRSRT
jgi:hypothetical protein